jgi:hypothetical protein
LELIHLLQLANGDTDLVRTTRGLKSAGDALETLAGVLELHPLDEGGNALEIAIAAADDIEACDDLVIVSLEVNILGTGALGLVHDVLHSGQDMGDAKRDAGLPII